MTRHVGAEPAPPADAPVDAPVDAAVGAPVPVRQRLVIVLPSTGEFDSRTYRIASAVAGRGHQVTVLARLGDGLPADERHPAGYMIRRVHVSVIAGLPLSKAIVGRLERRRSAGRAAAPSASPATDPVGGSGPGDHGRGIPRRARRAAAAAWRMAAIGLTVRAQSRASRSVDPGADVYHAMAYMGVPVGLHLARRRSGASVVYDARDIYVDANNLARLPRPIRTILGRIERRWARAVDRVVTVNRPYAEVMAARWDVPLPAIVMNCSYRTDPPRPRSRRFHEGLGLPDKTRVVLYQGGFSPHRGIEQLLEAIPGIPDAVLVLLGYGVMTDTLERRVAEPGLVGRAFVMRAVPATELLDCVAAADVVAMPIQPSTLNHRLTTPNKLFEAIAVGVPVVASDLPGMASIALEAGGELCDPTRPRSIGAAIRRILDESPEAREARRERTLTVAHSRYTWEGQLEVLLEEYGRLTGRPW